MPSWRMQRRALACYIACAPWAYSCIIAPSLPLARGAFALADRTPEIALPASHPRVYNAGFPT